LEAKPAGSAAVAGTMTHENIFMVDTSLAAYGLLLQKRGGTPRLLWLSIFEAASHTARGTLNDVGK